MGVDTNIYLGPYVSCVQRSGETTTTVQACTNPRCKIMPVGLLPVKFCAHCGHPIGDSPRKVSARVHFYDVVGEMDFVDLEGGYHEEKSKIVLLGSSLTKRGGAPRDFHHHGDGDAHVDMTVVMISVETCWFEDRYADALGKLRESFDDVRVLWGFHLYYT